MAKDPPCGTCGNAVSSESFSGDCAKCGASLCGRCVTKYGSMCKPCKFANSAPVSAGKKSPSP